MKFNIQLLLFCHLIAASAMRAQTDTIAPTLICKGDSHFIMDQFCTTEFTAEDLIDSVSDNSQYYELGIRKACTGVGFPEYNSITFYIGETALPGTEIWARDSSGNTATCTIDLFILDNGFCDPGSRLYFKTVDNNDPIDGVYTQIKGQNCQMDSLDYRIPGNSSYGAFWFSSQTGLWMSYFCFAPSVGYNYDISPDRNDNPLNGVTTYDLTLISKHVLGITPLDSPYKIIAADVNQDGKVTTFDILLLRKLILGLSTQLPNGKSWRFIPANYVFPNPSNPFDPGFPEKITITNAAEYNCASHEFLGIKIGDLNFTASPD